MDWCLVGDCTQPDFILEYGDCIVRPGYRGPLIGGSSIGDYLLAGCDNMVIQSWRGKTAIDVWNMLKTSCYCKIPDRADFLVFRHMDNVANLPTLSTYVYIKRLPGNKHYAAPLPIP